MEKNIFINNKPTLYSIDEQGIVRNKRTGYLLKGGMSIHGYRFYTLSLDGHKYTRYLHRLLAEAFLGLDTSSNLVVNHKDGNKLNNELENLEIISLSENTAHAFETGLRKRSVGSPKYYELDLPNENWRTIPNTNNKYEVSNLGRIKSLYGKTPRLLKQETCCGYSRVTIKYNGENTHFLVHLLVFFTFHPEIVKEDKKVIDHIDGDKLNNNLENLRYVSSSENTLNAYYEQKLCHTAKKVIAYKNGVFVKEFISIAKASAELGVDNSSISKVCRGKMKSICGYTFQYSE